MSTWPLWILGVCLLGTLGYLLRLIKRDRRYEERPLSSVLSDTVARELEEELAQRRAAREKFQQALKDAAGQTTKQE